MIETVDIKGSIKRVEILTDEDSGSREHGAYRIVIQTDRGTWEITGCHDMGPDASDVINPNPPPERGPTKGPQQ